MISIYELKPKFQQMLMPFVDYLYKHNVTPNQVTVSACLLSIIIGMLFYFNFESGWIYAVLPVFMFVRMAMNAIDGVLAKKFNLESRLGKFLNELTDVISDTVLFIPFILLTQTFQAAVIIFIALSIISEMSGVLAEVTSGKRRYDGPMGKSDRAFLIGAVSVLILFSVPLEPYLHIVFIAASLLIAVNIYKRVLGGLEEN
ncbi:Inner membrane protein YnbA [Jeotgalicoccus saudimassiliensis]|uniref:Inner membrane protein YnbA n=1 Tax=Jeotgalicoccus saudimassiliensis TaxID=1461582 RepID=A0A078MBN5_9STAP|nr:CDP-alcohol phosphatidyltransferase family protein [Jeotgalicoccus saudimassiliensis]CEA03675.1 Inner membrane protein YnbA [Jeotgalicoccus saudimassiliensis]